MILEFGGLGIWKFVVLVICVFWGWSGIWGLYRIGFLCTLAFGQVVCVEVFIWELVWILF